MITCGRKLAIDGIPERAPTDAERFAAELKYAQRFAASDLAFKARTLGSRPALARFNEMQIELMSLVVRLEEEAEAVEES